MRTSRKMADEKDTAAADSQTILDEYQRIWGVVSRHIPPPLPPAAMELGAGAGVAPVARRC